MSANTARKGPLRVERKVIQLSPESRMLHAAMRMEATRPTLHLRFRTLAGLLVGTSGVSLGVGFYLGRIL